MPRRLGTILFPLSKTELENLCIEKGLNEYETEIIMRIYWKKQSINFIADTMAFNKYGKRTEYYSVRTINNMHKEAFLKLTRK